MLFISGTEFGRNLHKLNFSNFICMIKNNVIWLFTAPNFIKIKTLLIFGTKFGLIAKSQNHQTSSALSRTVLLNYSFCLFSLK